jgi:hypothetical protein
MAFFTGLTDFGHTGGLHVDVDLAEPNKNKDGEISQVGLGVHVFTAEPQVQDPGTGRFINDRELNASELSLSISGRELETQTSAIFGVDLGRYPQDSMHTVLNSFGVDTGYFDYPPGGDVSVSLRGLGPYPK